MEKNIPGTGMGLLITKRLVRLLRGRISFESRPGEGTEFVVTLPLHYGNDAARSADTPDSTATEHDTTDTPAEGRCRIFIIDDDADMRSFLKETLGGEYDVTASDDPAAMLQKIREESPDMVIADVMMPRLRGDELCRIIKTDITTSHIPVILLSGLTARRDVVSGLEAESAGLTTDTFAIAGNCLWDESCCKVLNFIYSQRCGYPVYGVHSLCHSDLCSVHDGLRRSFSGGWHDAGDLSQQTLQTADVVYSLLELYDRKRDTDPAMAARLREEALWGLDFVLRNRFGDGYHASSMGLLIWTDGVHGSHDDISSVRIQNISFDNYLYAAYEAYAARILSDDPALAAYLAQVAREDYGFACAKYAESGFGGWISPYEHTYCTSESQHMATASWASSLLYELTGEEPYADAAAEYARYVLDCQCYDPVGHEHISGFFFRTPEKRSVVHFIHQSREQVYMQAMTALCRTQPAHTDYRRWHRSIAAYGDYLKAMMCYTAPYGMLPSGIYRNDEQEDTDAFYALHLFPPADAPQRFDNQRRHGVDVGDGFFVKRFPVWFNIFNGNLAVHTSTGKAAALCARHLHDPELMDISREQLYWIVGKNPFAQSLIYGEGHRYPELNNFSSGRITGAMPVGIRSLGDSDEPYWPQFNCACYKEVWVTSAGKWLSLVAETYPDGSDRSLLSQSIPQ